MSILGLLTSRAGLITVAVILSVVALAGAFTWSRHEAATTAVNQVAIQAAQNQERVRREGDTAARAAERDDVGDRLRRGAFLLDPVPPRD